VEPVDSKKKPVMLFAIRDIPTGGALSGQDMEERPAPAELVTTSWIRTEDRPQAVGRVVLAPFRRGDPILWTHLKADGAK
jgi:Flp pilus assembly protein CpaB